MKQDRTKPVENDEDIWVDVADMLSRMRAVQFNPRKICDELKAKFAIKKLKSNETTASTG